MPKVIVLDTLAPEGLDLLAAAKDIKYEVRTGLKGDALRRLAEFDGAICRSGVKITAECLKATIGSRPSCRAGVGTDNIDSKAATRLGIVVMNTPAGNTLSTAEHAFAMMLALSRNIAPAYQSLIEGNWDRNQLHGHAARRAKRWASSAWAASARRSPRGPRRCRCACWASTPFFPPSGFDELGHRAVRQRGRDAAAGRLPDRAHAADRRDPQPGRHAATGELRTACD